MSEPNRIVTLDASTRLGQSAICAALRTVEGIDPIARREETPERRKFREQLFEAIRGIPVDRSIIASDGKTAAVILVEGTPYLNHLFEECTLNETIFPHLVEIPARGLWMFEGHVDCVKVGGGYFDPDEWETIYDGNLRAITEEDRVAMQFTDEMMIDEAYYQEIDLRDLRTGTVEFTP